MSKIGTTAFAERRPPPDEEERRRMKTQSATLTYKEAVAKIEEFAESAVKAGLEFEGLARLVDAALVDRPQEEVLNLQRVAQHAYEQEVRRSGTPLQVLSLQVLSLEVKEALRPTQQEQERRALAKEMKNVLDEEATDPALVGRGQGASSPAEAAVVEGEASAAGSGLGPQSG